MAEQQFVADRGEFTTYQQEREIRAQVVAFNREEFPDGCELCGEPADYEMGEFWVPETEGEPAHSVLAHAQCGLDAGLEIA